MSVIKCIRGKVATGKLTKEQGAEIEDRLRRYEEKNRRGMNPEQAEALAAKQAEEAFTKEKATKARQTRLSIARQADLNLSRQQYQGDGYRWLLSEMDVDPWGKNNSPNVFNLQEIHRNRAFSMMNDLLTTFRPQLAGLKRPRAGMDDVVRELHGQSTGLSTAKEMAEGFRAAAKYLWTEFNRFSGDTIAWRDDWAMPHLHDAVKVGGVAPDQWIDTVMPLLNREKMVDFSTGQAMSDAELRTMLRDVYEGIRTHGMDDMTPGSVGGRSVGNRRSDPRMLQFKDGDAWLKYNEQFGSSDPYDVMLGYVHSMSRDIGLMEKFGPNPKAMVQTMKDVVAIDNAKKGPPIGRKGYKASEYKKTLARGVDNTYAVISGAAGVPINGFWAGMAAGTRNFISAALLQRAFLSAVTDINGQRIAMRMVGMPEAKALTNIVRNLKGAMVEDQQVALHLSLGADSWTQVASGMARFTGDVEGPEWTRRLADTTMRATLLTPWTQGGKNVFGMDFYSWLYRNSSKGFDALPADLRGEMQRFGINSEYWDVIRAAEPYTASNGAKYVNPISVHGIAGLGREASTRMQNMQLTLQRMAVIEASPRVRAAMMGGTLHGTLPGEIMKSIGTFKNFPLTLMHMQLFNGVLSRNGNANKAKMMANVVIGSMLFGALAYQAKEIYTSGRDPMDMTDPRFWAAAMAQGGGLGIFGDFIFADQNRFGRGFKETVAGPVMDLFNDVIGLTLGNAQEFIAGKDTHFVKEAARVAGKYFPLGKYWYWGLAFQRKVLDQLDEAVDPKAHTRFRRQERQYLKDRKQKYWWKPGRTAPKRAPDLGAATGK